MRRNKFRAIKTVIDNKVFHSKAEAARFVYLQQLEDEDQIYMLECQVPYQLFGEGHKGSKYIADFRYYLRFTNAGSKTNNDDIRVVEDVKGHMTAISKMKIKMMKQFHNIDVQIIKMNPRTVNTLLAAYLGKSQQSLSECARGSYAPDSVEIVDQIVDRSIEVKAGE